jgi:hypothetical protein
VGQQFAIVPGDNPITSLDHLPSYLRIRGLILIPQFSVAKAREKEDDSEKKQRYQLVLPVAAP